MLELKDLKWDWLPWPSKVRPGQILWHVGSQPESWYGSPNRRRTYLEALVRATNDPEAFRSRGIRTIDLCMGGAAGTAYYKILLEVLDRDPTTMPGVDDDDLEDEEQPSPTALAWAAAAAAAELPEVPGEETQESELNFPERSEESEPDSQDADEISLHSGSEPTFDVGVDVDMQPAESDDDDTGTRTPGAELDSDKEKGSAAHAVAAARLKPGKPSEMAALMRSLDRKPDSQSKYWWGAFTIECKTEREWLAECPFHKLHPLYGCRKSLTIEAPGAEDEEELLESHFDVIDRLKLWCLQSNSFCRQRDHVGYTPQTVELPERRLLDDMLLLWAIYC